VHSRFMFTCVFRNEEGSVPSACHERRLKDPWSLDYSFCQVSPLLNKTALLSTHVNSNLGGSRYMSPKEAQGR
jgi:hypothetical protein